NRQLYALQSEENKYKLIFSIRMKVHPSFPVVHILAIHVITPHHARLDGGSLVNAVQKVQIPAPEPQEKTLALDLSNPLATAISPVAPEPNFGHERFADSTSLKMLPHQMHRWKTAEFQVRHSHRICAGECMQSTTDFGSRQAQRRLEENMLAGCGGGLDRGGMQMIRECDSHS